MHERNKIIKENNQVSINQQFNLVTMTVGVHIGGNKLIVTTEPKKFHFNLPKNVDINLKHEIYVIISHNELLAEPTVKNEIRQLLFGMETKFMNTENDKKNEPHKYVHNLSQRLDLKSSNKHVALQTFVTLGKI